MDQVHVVRHKVLVEGRSQRAVARELGLARVTVRKYLDQAIAARRPEGPRSRPVWDAVGPRVEALLTESVQWTGGKQRLTATRLHELLVAEGQVFDFESMREYPSLLEPLLFYVLHRVNERVHDPAEAGSLILNFAERVLPRASDLWIQASLEQRQRLQRLFFPEGVAFSGKSFARTVVTSSLFEYLRPLDGSNENLVAQIFTSWNPLISWLRHIEALTKKCCFVRIHSGEPPPKLEADLGSRARKHTAQHSCCCPK